MKINLKKRQTIIFGVIFLITAVLLGNFFNKSHDKFNYEEAKKADISQEVSVSGNIKKGDNLGLNFSLSGKINKIYVKAGDAVEEGQKLAELDSSSLYIQLQSAAAQLKTAQAGMEKLLAGASQEDIVLAQKALQNADSSFQSARQKYYDTQDSAVLTLNNLYKSSLSSLADANMAAYNALNFLQSNVYLADSRDLAEVRDEIEKFKKDYQEGESFLVKAQTSGKESEIDLAVEKIKKTLESGRDSSAKIRAFWDLRSSATAAQKASLDTHQSLINASLLSAVTVQNNIALTQNTNQSNINVAFAAVIAAQGQQDIARENLNKLLAGPRKEDIDLAQAQIDQASSQASLLNYQIRETIIKAPIKGKISQINKKQGEQIQGFSGQDFIILIPKEPFQIEVNIPEVDIAKVNIEDSCRIDLDAFSEKQFFGKVIKIDPAETIIAGVIYYKTTISLDTEDEKIKPGMTANVVIVTEFKENVLTVPQRAIFEKQGKKMVRIVNGKSFDEIEVQTGLKGVQGEVEIISGLKQGDKVVTFLKAE